MYATGEQFPSCTSTPTQSACGGDCAAHNIDYDYDVVPDWFFVSLSGVGQITAIRADDYSVQYVVYKANVPTVHYQPFDHVVVGN